MNECPEGGVSSVGSAKEGEPKLYLSGLLFGRTSRIGPTNSLRIARCLRCLDFWESVSTPWLIQQQTHFLHFIFRLALSQASVLAERPGLKLGSALHAWQFCPIQHGDMFQHGAKCDNNHGHLQLVQKLPPDVTNASRRCSPHAANNLP